MSPRETLRVRYGLAVVALGSAVFMALGCSGSNGGADRRAGETAPSSPGVVDRFVVAIEPEATAAADDVGVDLARLAKDSLARVADALPELEKVVGIEVDPSRAISGIGVGGRTDPVSGEVFVYLDPDGINADGLRMWLPEALAHEAHHRVRIRRGPGYGTTLGEWIVTEGLATVFAREVFPAIPVQPWAQALSGREQGQFWAMAQLLLAQAVPDLDATGVLHGEWFFGRGSIPRWAGYTLGVELVTAYLTSHPGTTAAALVRGPAASIIADSGYNPTPPDPNRPRCFTDASQSREVPCDEYQATLAASGIVTEPGKCYLITGFTASEVTCISAANDDA